MSKEQAFKNVVEFLKKKKVPITRMNTVRKTERLIMTPPVIILIDKNSEVNLAFHIASNPEFSAKMSLGIEKLEGVKKVNIGETFILKDEEVVTGEDAIKEFDKQTYDGVIKNFIREQMEDHLLKHGPAKNC